MFGAGLDPWGVLRWARLAARALVCLALGALAASCGDNEGRKRAIECRADDDCDASDLGECDSVACEADRCVLSTKPDGQRCSDQDPLTHGDACLSGICTGVLTRCDDDLGPCLKAVHDPETDECLVEPAPDGAPCDDADACTQKDLCQAGECVGEEPKACPAADDCHVEGECDPETGVCSERFAGDGTPCDDTQACTMDDACTAGVCAGQAVTCDDGLTCSVDSCDPASGACSADMKACACVEDSDCDDGNACNGSESCSPTEKLCQAGRPVVCSPSTDPCLSSVCLPETGVCQAEPVRDGTACDDANACTARDTCKAGQCVGAEPFVCSALSQCHTAGTCNRVTGACSNPEKAKGSPCNDGNACTVTDTCSAGACIGSATVTCRADDTCHVAGVCDAATGSCSKPIKPDGVACDDANPCSLGDACRNGICTPSGQVVCTAADSCHSAGSCDIKTGLCNSPPRPDGSVCSDGFACTAPDTCLSGKCQSKPVTCDDGINCTVDSCSERLGGCTSNSAACACKTSSDCNDGNPCNGVETCNLQTLQCQPGTAVDCSTLNDACNVGVCDAATGKCGSSPKANGTSCDDGNLCTLGSSCQAGVCQGQNPKVCAASDQCHEAGTCNSATGMCSNPVKANGASCNDGNACTQTDSCQSGLCTGSNAVVCTASDQCHTAGVCDSSSGICSNPVRRNGSLCSDGDSCTRTDSCQGGVCVGASPVTCVASDPCHSAGKCDPATGSCSNPAKTDGAVCDDGSRCTQVDTCQKGICTGAKPVTCVPSDQCHTAGSCDPATGGCSNPAKKDGTLCDDLSLCTKLDSCQAGTCTGTSPVTCSASDQCHDAGSCDPKTGICSNPDKPDSTPCNDAKACTSADKCIKGVCAGAAIACDDKIACSLDSCVEPLGCTFDRSKCGCAKDADCNDGNACNGVETCNLATLSCVTGTAVNCAAFDDACNAGTCDSKTGACRATPRVDGTSCDDGSACTRSDGCVAGKCVGKSPVACSASDPCHDVGSCDPKTGVCSSPSKPDGSGCDDGNKCTRADTCKTGTCIGGGAVVCAPSDQCHAAGTCDPSTGVCSNPPRTGSCDDGDRCTQTDACQSGVCVGSNPVVCVETDQCHDVGSCVKATGVCTNPAKTDGAICDDGDKCTQSDSCRAGRCTGSKPVVCAALGQCYALGSCDAQTGLCSNPFANAGTSCDDGNACTLGEVCDGKGTCGRGRGVVCPPPSNACLSSTCNVTQGCVVNEQPSGTPCDDGNACTLIDRCGKGGCVGTTPRANVNADWSDDPGSSGAGPTSVDTFGDGKGNAHLVGTYVAGIRFNDKDVPKTATPLALPRTQAVGIYWAVYSEAGAVRRVTNLGGVGFNVTGAPDTLVVERAAGHLDGSFTLLGTFSGTAEFGPAPDVQVRTSATLAVFVAHYFENGGLAWVAVLSAIEQGTVGAGALAAHDDGSVVAMGSANVGLAFEGKPVTTSPGVWALRLTDAGKLQWAETVVFPAGSAVAAAVTTHEDGSASLTGLFTSSASLGPNREVAVRVSPAEGRLGGDIWFQKLDRNGRLLWAGRLGGTGRDLPGDVARAPGGGTLLLANTLGSLPSADDAKTTQPLHASTSSGLQTHVLGIDVDGLIQTDALIANPEAGGTRGYRLERDVNGLYAVAGVFAASTSFWSSVGFGSGLPQGSADLSLASLYQGPTTLYVARVDEASKFAWAVQAGGDSSGMTSPPWDVVMATHPSHGVTLGGMFNTNANFGDRVPETLQADPKLGNPFVVHLNSEAEYDYCR